MAIRLNKAILTDNGFPTVFRSTVYGHALTDGGIITDFGGCLLTVELQILRNTRDHRPRKNPAVFTNTSTIHDGYIGANPRAVFDDHILVDSHKRFNNDVPRNLRLGVYIC